MPQRTPEPEPSPCSRRRAGRLGRLLAATLALLAAVPAAVADETDGYRLGAGDRIRIRVYDRDDLSGEFVVRPPGVVSLPILGPVPVAGLAPADLEREIAGRLGSAPPRAGSVTVEVLESRPFFVVGDVRSPGAYPFVHGMTVLHAVALAGGYRVPEGTDAALRLEAARAREKLRLLALRLGTLLARRARLRGELAGRADFELPAEAGRVLGAERARAVLAEERAVLRERRDGLRDQLDILERRKAVFEEEIRAHRGQIAAQTKQAALIAEEIAELDRDEAARVVPKATILGLRRQAARLEGEKRESQAFIARARAQISEIDQTILARRSARRTEATEALQRVEEEIAGIRVQAEETRALLAETGRLLPRAWLRVAAAPEGPIVIVRREGDGFVEREATELSPLRPGDVVRIPTRVELVEPAPRAGGGEARP